MDIIIINQNDELYNEFDKVYGRKVTKRGNMTRKQFCDLIVNNILRADFIFAIDFNDIRTHLDYAQIADAATFTIQEQDMDSIAEDIMHCFYACHPQAKIRNLMIQICVNDSAVLIPQKLSDFINNVNDKIERINGEFNLLWWMVKDKHLNPGQMRIDAVVGLYNDIKDNNVRMQLSRKLAYLLRHTDAVDSQGFYPVIDAMRYCGVTEEELQYIVDNDSKNRYEMVGGSVVEGRIRARNGHSGNVKIDPGLLLVVPPDILYHGTTEDAADSILGKKEGLRGMSRQYVQLTTNADVALETAKRHKKSSPVLLEINASNAFRCGIHFYQTTNGIWQVEHIPYYYIRKADISSKS